MDVYYNHLKQVEETLVIFLVEFSTHVCNAPISRGIKLLVKINIYGINRKRRMIILLKFFVKYMVEHLRFSNSFLGCFSYAKRQYAYGITGYHVNSFVKYFLLKTPISVISLFLGLLKIVASKLSIRRPFWKN